MHDRSRPACTPRVARRGMACPSNPFRGSNPHSQMVTRLRARGGLAAPVSHLLGPRAFCNRGHEIPGCLLFSRVLVKRGPERYFHGDVLFQAALSPFLLQKAVRLFPIDAHPQVL